MKNKRIKVTGIFETSYEDGSYWIEYLVGNRQAYEITNKLKDGDEEKLQKLIDGKAFDTSVLVNKKDVNECCDILRDVVYDCKHSENDMWFLDEGELEQEQIDELMKAVDDMELHEYIEVDTDTGEVTVYGGAITKFIF